MLAFPFRRPLTSALAALFVGSAGAAGAASAGDPADIVLTVPDTRVLVAQARDLARRGIDENVLAALDGELAGLPPSLAFVQGEFGSPREIIKNAPYTAEALTESVQVLPDGNRIVRKSTTLLARDAAGRTRQERKADGRASSVFIHDPIDGRNLVLNETSRTAIRLPRMPAPPEPPAPPTGATPAVPPAPPLPPAAPELRSMKDVEIQPGRVIVKRRTGDGARGEDVQVEVIRIGGAEGASLPPLPPMPPLTLPLLPRGKGETKSLGTREFDGIKADGTLTSHTIPAGQVGNEKPIVVTSERWFSPELHVVVFARTSDPRAGETTYRLTNVKRGEPPAELFKVPADYRTRGEARRS